MARNKVHTFFRVYFIPQSCYDLSEGDIEVDPAGMLDLNILRAVPMQRATDSVKVSMGIILAQSATNPQAILLTRQLVILAESRPNQVDIGLQPGVAGGHCVNIGGSAFHIGLHD
jgi:hypothetical protein